MTRPHDTPTVTPLVHHPARGARARLLFWVALLAVAATVRLTSWREVFGTDRIRFLTDTDTYYHVLRAKRILEGFPAIPWTDPGMNFPVGAEILWPPLFDLLIVWPALALGGTPVVVERVATVVPVILGLVMLLIVGALGTVLVGRRAGMVAASVLAFLPGNVEFTLLGRPDQHVMELVASGSVYLTFLRGWRDGRASARARRGWSLAMGAGVVVAFWNWQGSGMYLVLLAGFVGLWHLWRPREAEVEHPAFALALGTTAGAIMLGASLALFAPARLGVMRIMGVTGFHLVLVTLTAAFSWVLVVAERIRPPDAGIPRRLGEVAMAVLLPLGAVAALTPGVRESAGRGLAALGAANAWYASIQEFQPFFRPGRVRTGLANLVIYFGLTFVLAPLWALAVTRRWRRQPAARPMLMFLLYWGGLMLVAMLARVRFNLYAAVPGVLWLAVGLDDLADWAQGRFGGSAHALWRALPALGTAVVVAPVLPILAMGHFREASYVTQSAPVLGWLRSREAPMPGRDGVLSSWHLGHAIQYFARKPVLVTPFGTDGGDGAMEAAAAFYLASNPEAAEAALERRRVGFVLLANPSRDVHMLAGLTNSADDGPVRLVPDASHGESLQITERLWELPAARLYFTDGSGVPRAGAPGLGGYRLVFETPSTRPSSLENEGRLKLYEVVRGAVIRVEGEQPGVQVVADVPVVTNSDRRFRWLTVAQVDETGGARLRVPYASGPNGQVRAGPCSVTARGQTTEVVVGEADVLQGRTLVVSLRQAVAPPVPRR